MIASTVFKLSIAVLAYAVLCSNTAVADGFNFANFKEIYANGGKEKDAEIVYVLPDASIAKKGDPGASPAIRLALSSEPEHLIMQDISFAQSTKDLDVSVEVWASKHLQHGKGDGEWSNAEPGLYYIQAAVVHPNVDFWFLRGVGHGYFLTNLDLGKWKKVTAHFTSPYAANLDHFEFHVPVGTGFILLRNFVVSHTN